MTTHDDPGLGLLERDLHELAAPAARDESFRLELRARLAEQARTRPSTRRRRLGWALATAAGAAAAATTAVLLAGGSGGPGTAGAAVLRHVRAAVSLTPNSILHEKVVAENGAFTGESWQETGPPYAGVFTKGPVNGPHSESADNGTATYEYDASTNTIHQRPDSSAPTFQDPVSQVRQMLDDGRAQPSGQTAIDGAPVYRINLPNGLVGYFDAGSYRPIAIDDPQRDGTIVRLRVVAFEYLPRTPQNLELLSMTTRHPDARVDTNPGATSSK